MSERAPILIANGLLYQLSDTESDNFIQIGSKRFSLVKSAEIADLEKLDREFNEQDISDYKKKFVEGILKKEVQTLEEMKTQMDGNKILSFILNEMFPMYIDGSEKDMDAMLSGKKVESKEKGILDAALQEEYKVTENDIQRLKKELAGKQAKPMIKETKAEPKDEDELESMLKVHYKIEAQTQKIEVKPGKKNVLADVLETKIVVLFGGAAYKAKARNDADEIQAVLNGEAIGLEEFASAESVEEAYVRAMQNLLNAEAVDDYSAQLVEIQKIRAKNDQIKKFAEKESFEMGDIGFTKIDGRYHVYLKVPKFAMQNPVYKDQYHPFPACRVAVRLVMDSGRVSVSKICVIEDISHPFLPGGRGDGKFREICMGSYHFGDLQTLKGITDALSAAVNVITNGYSKNVGPHHKIDDFHYVSRKEAEKDGYQITNLH